MANGPRAVDVSVDARDFASLLGRTSRLSPELKKALRRRVREAGLVAAGAAKEEVLKEPLTHGRRPQERGLRRGIARGIKVQLAASQNAKRVGVVIKSSGSPLSAAQKPLVRRWNKPSGWRHPLFGNTEHWYPQKGRPYWGSVMSRQKAELERRVRQALDEALQTLGE
jgi:hypothetical protein